MADVQPSQPRAIPGRGAPLDLTATVSLPPPQSASQMRRSNLNVDIFSPVNQNGSFEFDRVLKCGLVQKRTRKTKVSRTEPST